jgi:uncharacterized protein YeaO (DUF488 family)
MNLYTFQLAAFKSADAQGIPWIDTTVKSGLPLLAPSWEIVMGVKSGRITHEQYTAIYWQGLVDRYHDNPEFFEWLVAHEDLALGCYCAAGLFCHRHIIVEFLKHITEVCYCGELTE